MIKVIGLQERRSGGIAVESGHGRWTSIGFREKNSVGRGVNWGMVIVGVGDASPVDRGF